MPFRRLRVRITDTDPFCRFVIAALLAAGCLASPARSFAATPVVCTTGALPSGSKASPPDLVVTTGTCTVGAGQYYFHNINIFGGGALQFSDTVTEFWAESILIQNSGSLIAGSTSAPIGSNGGRLTIHLWGVDQGGTAKGPGGGGGMGIECLMPNGTGGYVTDPMCGVPSNIWNSNKMSMSNMNPSTCTKASQLGKGILLPGAVDDCFYQYEPIVYDDGDPNAYFGYKVLALSYGGILQLYGRKGATYPEADPVPSWSSGTSWARLAQNIDPADTLRSKLVVVDRQVDWKAGDQIIITTTDYLPGHSERMTIASVASDHKTIQVVHAFEYPHNGTQVDLAAKGVPASVGPQDDPNLPAGNGRLVDTRAAVGLLSRSIRIVSGGDTAGSEFPQPVIGGTSYYFGGHTLVRQGFKKYQIQGVEFFQLGQGGRLMHYPVHFHMARKTPRPILNQSKSNLPVTFVRDSSVWDSMTRWYTIHATQGVTLARNVGYLSIGHGYYLEDATETDNVVYSNLGVFARAAVQNPQNPRNVPGIFAGGYLNNTDDPVPYTSDVDHPTVFWIPNGWNDFQYNMAVGANACGVCYWFLPAGNSGMSRLQAWESYASEQKTYKSSCNSSITGQPYTCDNYATADTSPLKKFVGNSCSTAMESFLAISVTNACGGVVAFDGAPSPTIPLIPNNNIPPTPPDQTTLPTDTDFYYPKIDPGGSRLATKCPNATEDCNPFSNGVPTLQKCGAGQETQCMVTVLDHFHTSFNWAQQNFSAVWLRPQWYLVSNSSLADIQTGGLTMVTGGDYTDSSVIPGYWGLARNDVFIGETQPTNYFASAAGPFNKYSMQANPSLVCAGNGGIGSYCLNVNEGMTMPLSNFAVNQRLYNIYDGPSYQDSNAYLDVKKTTLAGCTQNDGAVCSGNNGWMYGLQAGIPMDTTQPSGSQCYMPNAAVAWKQPNGFFYPPAFHAQNLYFGNVDVRHFVIEPLFSPSDYLHPFVFDQTAATSRYCTWNSAMFSGSWTDIDRQTELTDDDGSLTGLISQQVQNKGTDEVIVVNEDNFFNAPYQDVECGSDINTPPLSSTGTAKSSPYEYVTTVEYPACASSSCSPDWSSTCTDQTCYGVPLYRLDATGSEFSSGQQPFITMMGAAIYQRDTLTVNNGTYYIDTTVPLSAQQSAGYGNPTAFSATGQYYTFLLYAKPTTVQTYQMFIGTGMDSTLITGGTTVVSAVQMNKANPPFTAATIAWPGNWTKTYNPTTGILSVTMNLAGADFTATSSQCQPANFCTMTAGSCGCSLQSNDPTYTPSIFAQCQAACSTWAVKDIDCPDAGCYGFGVDLSQTTFANNTAHITPPSPACFPNTSDWNAGFAASTVNSGGCQYTTLPSSDFCSTGGHKQRPSAVVGKTP